MISGCRNKHWLHVSQVLTRAKMHFVAFVLHAKYIEKNEMLKINCEKECKICVGVCLRNKIRSGNTLSRIQIKCQ